MAYNLYSTIKFSKHDKMIRIIVSLVSSYECLGIKLSYNYKQDVMMWCHMPFHLKWGLV